jgi:hypothetical protein
MRQYVTFTPQLPIIYCKTEDFIPTLPEFEAYQKLYEQVMEENPKHVQIFDLGDLKLLPSEIRISQGKWIVRTRSLVMAKVKGIAFVAPSFVGRTVLKGIFIVSSPAVPYTIVGTIDEAEQWSGEIMNTP